jgi:hypothetical protein
MRTQLQYVVHIALSVNPNANTVTKVGTCVCSCRASAAEDCQHISAALFTVHDIVRGSGRIDGMESLLTSSTSELCWWRAPTGKHSEDVKFPIQNYMMTGRKAVLNALNIGLEIVQEEPETIDLTGDSAMAEQTGKPPSQHSTPASVGGPLQVTLTTTPKGATHTRYREDTTQNRSVETTPHGAQHTRFREEGEGDREDTTKNRSVESTPHGAQHTRFREEGEVDQSTLSTTGSVRVALFGESIGQASPAEVTPLAEDATTQDSDARPHIRGKGKLKIVVKEEKEKRRKRASVGYDPTKIEPYRALLSAHRPHKRRLKALALSLNYDLTTHQAKRLKATAPKKVTKKKAQRKKAKKPVALRTQ